MNDCLLPDLCATSEGFEQGESVRVGAPCVYYIARDGKTEQLILTQVGGRFDNLGVYTELIPYCYNNPYKCSLYVKKLHTEGTKDKPIPVCNTSPTEDRYDCVDGVCSPSTTGYYSSLQNCRDSGCEDNPTPENGIGHFEIAVREVTP